MFTPLQIVLIPVALGLIRLELYNSQLFAKCFGGKVLIGFVVGLIMGDYPTGLLVGGTMELMSLGVAGYGGATIPNYFVATAVGTAFAVATDGGLDVALVVAIPVATLGTSFDVLAKMVGVFWLHLCEKLIDRGEFKKMYHVIEFATVFGGVVMISDVIPTILYLCLGSVFIEQFLAILPQWFINGLGAAGSVLPAIGMAILLKYLPVKENIQYLILGFVLFAYANLSIMPIALLGVVIAITVYKHSSKPTAADNAMAVGSSGIGDE